MEMIKPTVQRCLRCSRNNECEVSNLVPGTKRAMISYYSYNFFLTGCFYKAKIRNVPSKLSQVGAEKSEHKN
jgi:hypothetical protein